jgi:hypothetical protein
MAKFFRGDKRRREMDRKRRGEEKARRLQFRREMRAKGLDPDMVDADGNPLPNAEGTEGAEGEGGVLAGEAGEDVGGDETSADGATKSDVEAPAADRPK